MRQIVVGYWEYLDYVLDDMLDDWGVTCPYHRRAIEDDYWRHLDEGMGGTMRRAVTSWLSERGMTEVEVVVRRDEAVGPNVFIVRCEPDDGWAAGFEDEVNGVVEATHLEWLDAEEPWIPDDNRIDREHALACGAYREGRCRSVGMQEDE